MKTASVPIANIKNYRFCFSESGSPLHNMVIKVFLFGISEKFSDEARFHANIGRWKREVRSDPWALHILSPVLILRRLRTWA